MKESSDLVDLTEDAEDERVNGGRVRYDAGLKDRLAIALECTVFPVLFVNYLGSCDEVTGSPRDY